MGDIIFRAKNKITETSDSIKWVSYDGDINLKANGFVRLHGEDGEDLVIEPPLKRETTETKRLKKFLIHFRRSANYTGEYGFDWMRDEYIYPMTKIGFDNHGIPIASPYSAICINPDSFKAKYLSETPCLDPYGKQYFPAWLSLFSNLTPNAANYEARLNIELEQLEMLEDDGTIIEFRPTSELIKIFPQSIPISNFGAGGSGFIYESDLNPDQAGTSLKDVREIQNAVKVSIQGGYISKHEEIKVFAKLEDREEEIGKLMLYANNEVKKTGLTIVNVIINGVKAQLNYDPGKYLADNVLNQALIQFDSFDSRTFDIDRLGVEDEDAYDLLYTYHTLYSEEIVKKLINLYDKYTFFGKPQGGSIDSPLNKSTFIFLMPLPQKSAGGVADLRFRFFPVAMGWGNASVVFGTNLGIKNTLAHEYCHTLSLTHTFEESHSVKNAFPFYQGYSDNIMDYEYAPGLVEAYIDEKGKTGYMESIGVQNVYVGKQYALRKQQWDIMRNDRSIKY